MATQGSRLGLLVAATLLGGLILAEAAEVRPNIILLVTDDQGYGDLGIMGNPVLETPHMDALARQSATLDTFYVAPVCSPTRAGLMTGRYHYRTRIVDTFKGRSMMDPSERTLPEILRKEGYLTGIFGKWHLGDCYPLRPMDQGFAESFTHRGGGLAQPSEPIENQKRYTDPILFHNEQAVSTKGYCTDLFFEAALRFIDRAQQEEKPFFIYLPVNAPHGPFHDVPQELYEKYRQRDLGPVLLGNEKTADTVARVYAMIENIDENVGRLDGKIRAAGLWENTILVMLFDNGPNTRRFVGPLRGMKTEVHDGGIRSPFYMRWPARLPAGRTSDRVGAYIDVMPTLLDAVGLARGAELHLDGRSLLPLWTEPEQPWAERTLFFQVHRGDTPVRYHHVAIRRQKWKLVHPSGFGREQPMGKIAWELYDMEDDPGESSNLAAKHPELVESMRQEYDQWFDQVSQTRPDNYDPPRIVVGTAHELETVLTWQDWRVLEGDGWGGQGQWWLRFAEPQSYDVDLRWPESKPMDHVVLRIGAETYEQIINASTNWVRFENVTPPVGDQKLWAEVRHDGNPSPPYHVILRQRH